MLELEQSCINTLYSLVLIPTQGRFWGLVYENRLISSTFNKNILLGYCDGSNSIIRTTRILGFISLLVLTTLTICFLSYEK